MATSMDECPVPGDLGPERTLTCQWGVCSARPFANYGCLAKHLKRVHKVPHSVLQGTWVYEWSAMERRAMTLTEDEINQDSFACVPCSKALTKATCAKHMTSFHSDTLDAGGRLRRARGAATLPRGRWSPWPTPARPSAAAALARRPRRRGGAPPKRHRVGDAPAAAARGRPSAFSLAEKQFIALQCSKFFDHVRTDSAPPLNCVRDDIALAGLAGREFTVAVDPSNADEFKKFVESVRHVARSWVDYLPAADAD